MAGTIPISMTQQFDVLGKPLSGGTLYIITAGTVSTPQDAFVDTALTVRQPYPMTLDAAGRVPQFFLSDPSSGGNSTVKIRLQDKNGVVQLASDAVLVIGPSGGSSTGTTVDPTQLIQTGNMILRYGTGLVTGYVRLNGLTIGSATSGATERANLDCQACFNFLWTADATLAVSGGRGASAAADWSAAKQLTLPDMRSRLLMGLADMGNTNNGVLASTTFSKGNPTTLGSLFGNVSHTQTLNELFGHNHGIFLYDPKHNHTLNNATTAVAASHSDLTPGSVIGAGGAATIDPQFTFVELWSGPGQTGVQNATSAVGGNLAMDITNPAVLVTIYLKL